MINLHGQHVLIFGGSRGIGAASARIAARAGAAVTINYLRDSNAAEAVVAAIIADGGRAQAIQGDIAADGVAKQVVAQTVDRFGALTGAVVAAGIFEPAPIVDMSVDFWERTMRCNLRSTFLSVQACVPEMRKNGSGSIVIFSSTAGQRGSDIYSAYATSKGAQILFMRSMAKELAADNIRCNCVAPGWTETDMASATIDKIGRADIVQHIPLGRIGNPEDPANAAIFLISPLACFITGSTITVDGGMDMRG